MDHSIYNVSLCVLELIYSKEVHNNTKMTVLVVKIFYVFETHGIGQTPSSLEHYLVYNAYAVTCQLCNFGFACITLYTHLSFFKHSKCSYCWQWEWEWEGMGIELSGKIGMGMRYWNVNGNGREWE